MSLFHQLSTNVLHARSFENTAEAKDDIELQIGMSLPAQKLVASRKNCRDYPNSRWTCEKGRLEDHPLIERSFYYTGLAAISKLDSALNLD